jgi:hypothetical protein
MLSKLVTQSSSQVTDDRANKRLPLPRTTQLVRRCMHKSRLADFSEPGGWVTIGYSTIEFPVSARLEAPDLR